MTTTITSCRDCEHFHEGEKVACQHYEMCKAGKKLSEKPRFFVPFKAKK